MVFFSCADAGKNRGNVTDNRPDTSGKIQKASGDTVKSNQTKNLNQRKDTTLQYKTEIRNNGPDQARIDSIKNAKTKKKK
jgi:hypothetical protein